LPQPPPERAPIFFCLPSLLSQNRFEACLLGPPGWVSPSLVVTSMFLIIPPPPPSWPLYGIALLVRAVPSFSSFFLFRTISSTGKRVIPWARLVFSLTGRTPMWNPSGCVLNVTCAWALRFANFAPSSSPQTPPAPQSRRDPR